MRGWLILYLAGILLTAAPSDSEGPFDGYRWVDGSWIPGLITHETWYTPAPIYSIGGAVFYAPNLMEATARWRGMSLAGYLDGVALMSPADLGRTVWIRRAGNAEFEGPFLSVDCAARQDMYGTVVIRGEVVEVGFETALRWGMVRGSESRWRTNDWRQEVEVVVSDMRPAWTAHPLPTFYPKWWERRVEFSQAWMEPPHSPMPRRDGTWRWIDGSTVEQFEWRTMPWVDPSDYELHFPIREPGLARDE